MTATSLPPPPKKLETRFDEWMFRLYERVKSNPDTTDLVDLTDGGDTTLHYHASDRARANHTGTQLASTISDFATAVRLVADAPSVRDYGATGDGSTDDLASINTAIAALNAGTITALRFPYGTYKVSAGINAITRSGSAIIGEGATITINAATGDILTVNGGSTVSDVYIGGINFETLVSRTTGDGISLLDTENVRIDSCTFTGQASGVVTGQFQYSHITNCDFMDCFYGIETTSAGDGLFVSGTRIKFTSGTFVTNSRGIKVAIGGGVYLSNVDITRADRGLELVPSVGTINAVFVSACGFDTCNYGVYASVAGTSDEIHHVQFDESCWIASNYANGVYMEGVAVASFGGCPIVLNKGYGVSVDTCREITFNGTFVGFNNVDNTADVGGFSVVDTEGLYIRGCNIFNESAFYDIGSYNQKRGVVIGTGCDNIHITDNNFAGHSGVDIYLGSALTVGAIRGNSTDKSNSVASAASITPDEVHDLINITGTTPVQNILSAQIPGRQIRLVTESACKIYDANNFKLASDFDGEAGDVISLIVTPSGGFTETGRSNWMSASSIIQNKVFGS